MLGMADGTTVPLSRGYALNQNKLVGGYAPVSGGDTVTGSAYIQCNTDSYLHLEFFNADKGYLSGRATFVPSGKPLDRYSVTATAHANARYARLTVSGSDYLAGNPAITLGSTMRPYMAPLACEKVYLEPLEGGYSVESIGAAIQSCGGSGGIVEGVSLSILEVA